jgi:hypothetical protein
LFYINLDMWRGDSGWMRMNCQDFKKKLMDNFHKIAGDPDPQDHLDLAGVKLHFIVKACCS